MVIDGVNLKWFKSYLSNRKQFINITKNSRTSTRDIKCGVPQGSILGPLLFLIYVNDLFKSTTVLSPITFADDTNLFYSDKNINKLFEIVNKEIKHVCEWFQANKLSLNLKKTKYLIFHPPRKKIPINLPSLTINNVRIDREKSTKFLGVIIDETLSWKNQIDAVNKKVSKGIGILYNAKFYLSKRLITQLYFAFVHSHISYCNIAWASTHKTKLKSLICHQKHAIRLINNRDRFTHARPLFYNMRILDTYALNIMQNLCLLYRCKEKTAPEVFHLTYVLKSHGKYSMRNNNLHEPFSHYNYKQYCFTKRGPYLWNVFVAKNPDLRNSTSLRNFKSTLKNVLLEEADLSPISRVPPVMLIFNYKLSGQHLEAERF